MCARFDDERADFARSCGPRKAAVGIPRLNAERDFRPVHFGLTPDAALPIAFRRDRHHVEQRADHQHRQPFTSSHELFSLTPYPLPPTPYPLPLTPHPSRLTPYPFPSPLTPYPFHHLSLVRGVSSEVATMSAPHF